MNVQTGYSISTDSVEAAQELYKQVGQDNISFAMFFCSPKYDLALLGKTLHGLFKQAPLIGCTTAGEIGPNGMQQNGIVGVSIQSDNFTAITDLISNLTSFKIENGISSCIALKNTLRERGIAFDNNNTFFLTLVDGLSKKEEHLLTALSAATNQIPLAGGSAADGTTFKATSVYYRGKFHQDAALLTLVHTDIPFTVFKENAYEDSGKQVIVTQINEALNTVEEFNGEPAVKAYAEIISHPIDSLNFNVTSNNPLALKFGKELFVRTVTFPDDTNGAAKFPYSCAIEEGMILKVTKPLDTHQSITRKFEEIKETIGDISVIFGFDCFCRQLIYQQHDNFSEMSDIMKEHNVIGFHTYGEQYHRAHVNQTFTGIALGKKH